MTWQQEPEDEEGAGVDVSTLAAMSEYSSTAGGSQPSMPAVLLPETFDQPMSHFDAPDPVRGELYWYALEQATQDPHPPDSDLPPAEVAALHMVPEDGDARSDAGGGRRTRAGELRVQSVMQREVRSVTPSTPLSEIRALFARLSLHQLPVTTDERLVGVISSNDLLQLWVEPLRRSRRNGRLQAHHLMQMHPTTVRSDATVAEAAAALCNSALCELPVVDAERCLLGVVTDTDLVRVLAGR
jgi:CBS domain-containing protein